METSKATPETLPLRIDLSAYLEAAAGSLMTEKRFAPVSEEAVFVFLQEHAAEIRERAVNRMAAFVNRVARVPEMGDLVTQAFAAAVYPRLR